MLPTPFSSWRCYQTLVSLCTDSNDSFQRGPSPVESAHQGPNTCSRFKRNAEPFLISWRIYPFSHQRLCLCSCLQVFNWYHHGQSWPKKPYCVWVLGRPSPYIALLSWIQLLSPLSMGTTSDPEQGFGRWRADSTGRDPLWKETSEVCTQANYRQSSRFQRIKWTRYKKS